VATTEVNVSAVIDAGSLNRYQIGVFILCGLFLIMDGFDVQAMGYVAPALITDWKIARETLTPVLISGLVGLFSGSMLFGMLGDRIGRRRVLLGATVAFSVFTLASGFATSLTSLLVIRFFAGFGLGAILPNATALIGEFSPKRLRIATMMIVTNGFTIGAAAGGFLAAWLIPSYGWRSVFYVGGLVPIVLFVPMYLWLPESLQFLALRRNDVREIAKWLKRIDPKAAIDGATRFVVAEARAPGVPITHLFREGRAAATLLIWAANFTNILNAYFVASWLPTVVRDMGYSTSIGVMVGATLQGGGVIGTLAIAGILARVGFVPVLVACFAVETVAIALIGQPGLSLTLLFVVAFLTGWGIFGGQPTLNSLSATYYPTDLRSTGIGAALGVGRCGGIIGPLIGGAMLGAQWSNEALFYAVAVPALVATLAALLLGKVINGAAEPKAVALAKR
jgi:AAHS family 4-hydroxybenzoate transporter-like MFS transporter